MLTFDCFDEIKMTFRAGIDLNQAELDGRQIELQAFCHLGLKTVNGWSLGHGLLAKE